MYLYWVMALVSLNNNVIVKCVIETIKTLISFTIHTVDVTASEAICQCVVCVYHLH